MTESEDRENGRSENGSANDPESGRKNDPEDGVVDMIERQADRMEASRRDPYRSILFGLGMFGMVGWSIAIPTLAGIFLGLWLDRAHPVYFSWTITLLFAGVVIGAIIAGRWLRRNR